MNRHYLGIDIGGSKSHALVADEKGQAVGFGEYGSGSHEVVGYPGLETALQAVINQALQQASLSIKDLSGAGFGVAGYDWPAQRQPHLEVIARTGLACPFEVVNDALVGLLAGASQGWGVAVVSGTGANAWGWDAHRRIGRVTGCGPRFGEYGGAADLVAAAARAVGLAWVRRGPATGLTQLLIEYTGAKDVEDLLEGLVMGRYRLRATAAPLIIEVANQGDRVAQELIEWLGRELGSLALGVVRQLDFQAEQFEVVLVGSLYDVGPALIEPMREVITAEAPRAALIRLTAPPVVGGVLLGMEVSGLESSAFRTRLIESTRALMEAKAYGKPGIVQGDGLS